jgi:tetratricopeptide (TPR) repeat protein
MDVTQEQMDAIKWDFNNTVEHGKSTAMLNALESVVGSETFARIYRRCLKEYAGKQLGWREFQRISQIESGQDLDWFFEEWVRSSSSAEYRVASQDCSPTGSLFNCTVRVERLGEMQMPVTVAARFEDGSEQRAQTDRLADIDVLTFQAKAALREVVIEPDATVALAHGLYPPQRELTAWVGRMPWTGTPRAALEAYREARELKIDDTDTWAKLGMLLYDAQNYLEALEAMTEAARSDSSWRFAALVWQGHLLDLLGRRTEAVMRYQEALKIPGSPSMEHSQYNLIIDKQWVQERLKTPFERK